MSLEDVFYRPNVSEIMQRGPILRIEIDPSASDLEKDLHVARSIQGLGNRVGVISYEYEIYPSELHARRVFKRGDLVKLRRYSSKKQAIEDKITPQDLIKARLSNLKLDKSYVGYDWQGLSHSDRGYRVCSLVECIQGYLIYGNAKGDEKIEVKSYSDTSEALSQGAKFVVSVPSVSKEERQRYEITLNNIPIRIKSKSDDAQFSVWFNIDCVHDCKEQTWMFHYGRPIYAKKKRVGREKVFCAHEVAAYLAAQRFTRSMYVPYVIDINPFLTPEVKLQRLFRRLTGQVVKEVTEKGRKAILNNTDIEILLLMVISEQNYTLRNLDKEKRGELLYRMFFK